MYDGRLIYFSALDKYIHKCFFFLRIGLYLRNIFCTLFNYTYLHPLLRSALEHVYW